MSLQDRIIAKIGQVASRLGFIITVAAVILLPLHKINVATCVAMMTFATVVCGGVALLCYLKTGVQ